MKRSRIGIGFATGLRRHRRSLATLAALPLGGMRGRARSRRARSALRSSSSSSTSPPIMLAIVVPVIVATLGFAWWFRAVNAEGDLPAGLGVFGPSSSSSSGRFPALVITFLGGIAWFGSHELDPYRPLPSARSPIEVEVVSLDWKWLFIYPDEGVATVNRARRSGRHAGAFPADFVGVMNSFFVPQLGSQIYTMAGMTTQLSLQADQPATYPRPVRAVQRRRLLRHAFRRAARCRPKTYAKWSPTRKSSGRRSTAPPTPRSRSRAIGRARDIYGRSTPKLFDAIVNETSAARRWADGTPGGRRRASRRRKGP